MASNKKRKQVPLSLGFIGGGLSSTIGQAHFAASRLDGRWQLSAGFFSRQREMNCKTAETWHIPQDRLYETWQSFVASEKDKLDAVVVLTPTPEHLEIVCALINEGVPIICEKPLVSSLEESDLINQTYQESRNFLSVTYNYSGYPMVRELRERIRNGELGRLQQIHFEMPQEVFLRSSDTAGKTVSPKSWRLKDGTIPTICLDLGVHLHHLAYFIIGKKPVRVIAEFSNYSMHPELVDNVMMWLEYEDEMKASFWMSKTALGNRNGLKLRLYGENGSAEWVQMHPEELRISYKDGTCITIDRAAKTLICSEARYNRYKAGHPSGFIEAFANLYCDIADALIEYRKNGKHNNPYVFGIDHSVRGLELFAAARESDNDRCWKELKK
jgi:predicted dehydrogenase